MRSAINVRSYDEGRDVDTAGREGGVDDENANERARTQGVMAWIEPEGYRHFIA